jgi:prophage antirepressor-like protein
MEREKAKRSVYLSEDVWRRAKAAAALLGVSTSAYIQALLRMNLDNLEELEEGLRHGD